MEEKNMLGLVVLGMVLVVILSLFSMNIGLSKEDVREIVTSEVSKIEIPYPELPEFPEPKELDLTEFNLKISELQTVVDSIVDEDKISEAKAEEIALEEVSMSRSFKKLIMSVLNEEESIENYKDIVEIYGIDVEYVSEGGEEVVIEFKVKYYNDGDDELEDLQRAKLSISFEIDGLDYDDEYEDLEVSDYDEENFELIKIYE